MSNRFVILLLSFALCLVGCKEKQAYVDPVAPLKKEQDALKSRIDSLKQQVEILSKEMPVGPKIVRDSVRAGDGMYNILCRMKVQAADRGNIVTILEDSADVAIIKPGQAFAAIFNDDGSVQRFRYAPNPATIHLLTRRDSSHFDYKLVEKPVTLRQTVYEGVLTPGSTLNGMLYKVGIPGRMVGVVSGVLQNKISFSQAREGDKFRILLEDTFFQDSIWIKGKVLYAEFNGKNVGHHEAFRYEDGDASSSYNSHYTESGEVLGGQNKGLLYPLDILHVTSPFGRRVHPITGKVKMHQGIDYRGATGTPIYVVADGDVIVSGYDEFSGNKIAVRHSDNTVSYYMHMSARLVSVGAHVKAHQVIGKVGSTGRSTGSHLHFGFKNEKGDWINPNSKTMIATPKLEGQRLARLKKQIAKIREQIDETLAAPAQKANDKSEVMVHTRVL